MLQSLLVLGFTFHDFMFFATFLVMVALLHLPPDSFHTHITNLSHGQHLAIPWYSAFAHRTHKDWKEQQNFYGTSILGQNSEDSLGGWVLGYFLHHSRRAS